jgi:hypothetical protein
VAHVLRPVTTPYPLPQLLPLAVFHALLVLVGGHFALLSPQESAGSDALTAVLMTHILIWVAVQSKARDACARPPTLCSKCAPPVPASDPATARARCFTRKPELTCFHVFIAFFSRVSSQLVLSTAPRCLPALALTMVLTIAGYVVGATFCDPVFSNVLERVVTSVEFWFALPLLGVTAAIPDVVLGFLRCAGSAEGSGCVVSQTTFPRVQTGRVLPGPL